MIKSLNLLGGLVLLLVSLNCQAITVSVQSPSNEVYALGFRLNGSDYGGAGRSYSKSNLPAGEYIFGIRVGGLIFGKKDVGCPYQGSKGVKLDKDTTAVLNYNGKTCSTRIYQRK